MQEGKVIWSNGKLIPWKEATVHVLAHTIHYSGTPFEGIRCYKTKKGPLVFRLQEHIRRFFDSAKTMYIAIPFTLPEIEKACLETIKANGYEECYIRPFAFRGYGDLGVYPKNNPVQVIVAVWPWGAYLGEEALAKGIRAKISSYTRLHPNIAMTKAKLSGNYANSQLAKIDAINDGYHEAILLSPNGMVAEGSGENIFIVRQGKLKTPPLFNILPGITRDSILEIARRERVEILEQEFSRDELILADEAFFCGTASEITPIREVDHHLIGEICPGPVTKRLQNIFFKVVKGEDDRFQSWLTPLTENSKLSNK